MVRKRGGRKKGSQDEGADASPLRSERPLVAPMPVPLAPNDRWSLDFVSDQFICGRRFRILAVFDDCTRECLAAITDTSLSGLRVARELDLLIAWRGRPKTIVAALDDFDAQRRNLGDRRVDLMGVVTAVRPDEVQSLEGVFQPPGFLLRHA